MTKTTVNNSTNLDLYLTNKFKGKRLSLLNKFLLELYEREAWRSCYFQKKPEEYKRQPDRFYLFTNKESMSSIVVKVNPSRPLPMYSSDKSVSIIAQVIKDDMIIESIFSKASFCNLDDDMAAIELLESILNE